ncbi:sulfur carrier protein ThiS [Paucibacter sp. DJ1R-11]|uniref:sulfur carrier protein ThiS n=1 Tax=Paucibacter sp. DJ1R-11 TaxID=2893556 RepID=UPI0021E492F9|nr:sulfur carrier protein ThiS [Paucibacter sp. DJ1R-11]MCV2365372.1 sulfur carrier protein ThiS [Paucibacter sp. DJ1R-11]
MNAAPHITIRLDEQDLSLPAGHTVADLLAQLERPPESVGTALNGQFLRREARASTTLQAGDQVLLFQPIVGG